MLLTAGFTEEVFFRGCLQTRSIAQAGSRLAGLLGSAALLMVGGLYLVSRGNLLACVVLHAGINAAGAMTMNKVGW